MNPSTTPETEPLPAHSVPVTHAKVPTQTARMGNYWLSKRDGSPHWHITHYDAAARQTRRESLHTADLAEATEALQARALPRPSDAPANLAVTLAPDEEIRPIPGYDGYFATSAGRIIGRKGKVLREYVNPGGYPLVPVAYTAGAKPGRRRTKPIAGVRCWRMVHQLVLLAFDGPRPPGASGARHLNDTKTDNRLVNLRYGTFAENYQDALRNGALCHSPGGTLCNPRAAAKNSSAAATAEGT